MVKKNIDILIPQKLYSNLLKQVLWALTRLALVSQIAKFRRSFPPEPPRIMTAARLSPPMTPLGWQPFSARKTWPQKPPWRGIEQWGRLWRGRTIWFSMIFHGRKPRAESDERDTTTYNRFVYHCPGLQWILHAANTSVAWPNRARFCRCEDRKIQHGMNLETSL